MYRIFNNSIKERTKTGGDLADIRGFVERWSESLIRVAGILHL
ncbi:MAG: DUF3987 domain-containing protein [Puniceicoccales bacterium]|nr:DUF3987 domain-containing protein [Puniceicoccales bacterium]